MARKRLKLDNHTINWGIPAAVGATIAGLLLSLDLIDWRLLFSGETPTLANLKLKGVPLDNVGFIFMSSLIGAAIAAVLHPIVLWSTLALLVAAMGVVSMSYYSFSTFNLWWMLPAIGLLTSGTLVFLAKEYLRRVALLKVKSSLEFVVPPAVLQKLLRDAESINIDDREVSATVLAIDIIGLSSIRAHFSTEDLMEEMRQLYSLVRDQVHGNGGVILKSYRGGFVCLFGDLMRRGEGVPYHAEHAVRCASELQKANARRAIAAASRKKPVYVLRMGVSSSRVMIGNIGDDQNIDTLFLGTALDEAENLKRACEANLVLFSRNTRDMFVKIDRASPMFQKKVLTMGNQANDTWEVFEFDPLFDSQETRREATKALRESANFQRTDERYGFKRHDVLVLTTNLGNARVSNISRGGMAIELDQSVAVGSQLRIKFEPSDETLKRRLENRELLSISVEVRWTKPLGAACLHGIMYKTLNDGDKAFLLQCLLESQEGYKAA